jgi:alpha-L-rhamnosidase
MNSFNHYAFGAVAEWLHRHVAGLDQEPGSAGWAHVRVRPFPDARLRWARAEHASPRGLVRSGWELVDDELALDVEIPPGARATVHVPAADPAQVREGGRLLADAPDVAFAGVADGRVLLDVPAGRYRFTAPLVGAFAAPTSPHR